jgi:hypothetical protein
MSERVNQKGRVATLLIAVAALVTALVVTVFGGLAAGAESPPENTALPTIAPTSPYVGTAVKGSIGSWTGEPTSYTYEWQLCGSKCEPIAGKTGKTYTPVGSDAGKSLKFAVTATNAFGSTTATSYATAAVAPTLRWYGCTLGGSNVYEDSNCTTTASPSGYSWNKNGTNNSTIYTTGTSYQTIKWISGGIVYAISCSGATGAGKMQTEESGARINEFNLTFTGCFGISPTGALGCHTSTNNIALNTLKAKTPEYPSELKPELSFEPNSGTTVMAFNLEGCSASFLNGYYQFTGWFPLQVDNATRSFNASWSETKGKLKMFGAEAGIYGSSEFYWTVNKGHGLKLALAE